MPRESKRVAVDTRGLSREQRAKEISIKRGRCPSPLATCRRRRADRRMEWVLASTVKLVHIQKAEKAEYERKFGGNLKPRVVPEVPYQQKTFGHLFTPDEHSPALLTAVPQYVVSIALFDGKDLLFACSGIALPEGPEGRHIQRFVTSGTLVKVFDDKRNTDDDIRVQVRLPDNRPIDGFLGLYDDDIAIVSSFEILIDVRPVDLDRQPNQDDMPDIRSMFAFGRAFHSGNLMVRDLPLLEPVPIVDDVQPRVLYLEAPAEAALGGPLVDSNGNFLGMMHCHDGRTNISSLPLTSLRQRLKLFGVLTNGEEDTNDAGTSSGSGTRNGRHRYSLPSGVQKIVPSGFMRNINSLKSKGYPEPPPLMLEMNAALLNSFEDEFGEVTAWRMCDYTVMVRVGGEECVWGDLPNKVHTNIARRSVTVVSFSGDKMFFACTGLLISWHERRRTRVGTRTRMRARSVILTSASLVRACNDEDEVDGSLRIEVFLAPRQRANGTLELYHLDYNIAIISVDKQFVAARPEDIFNTVEKPSKVVVAIGREYEEGALFAALGKVTNKPRSKPSELDCKDLKLSTCKIKKIGTGGPLISYDDGSFVGMNFYDDSDKTPFLPRSKIVDVLKGFSLPSESGSSCPINMMGDAEVKKNRWPVPEAYWYHPLFDPDFDPFPPYRGRILQ